MSSSPFMTPDRSRRRRDLVRRRRRRRQTLAACALALAILVALALTLTGSKSSDHGAAAASTRKDSRPATAATAAATGTALPRLSPDGLALGTPPLKLTGIAPPAQEPVQIAFHAPPRAGLLFNLSTGQVLWQRNPFVHLHIASLTKMMTALVTVESAPPDAHVLVTKQAVEAAGSKVGVLPLGRHVRLESMLYGLLLPSGNDAAVALAQYVSGSVTRFVARMNAQAAALGLGCTRYASPSGYIDQGNFSCAADLAVLAHVDLEQPRIARITRTFTAALPFPIHGGRLYLYNNNPLLIYHYAGVTGLKTGYTVAAGRCLVATAERDGVRLGVVLLNSPAPGTQARQLLDRGFVDVYHQARVPDPQMPPEA
jgi:D-alanyl-D-alanine carboxypeptidase (penicillin-binding protein 5/6)